MNKFSKYNLIIIITASFIILLSIIAMTSYNEPKKLNTITKTVVKFSQRDTKWYDFLFNGGNDKYFNLTLEEDLFFTSTGIAYDNIDRSLFDDLIIGSDITITYNDEGIGSNNKIYNIEYNGKNYLDINVVLSKRSQTKKDFTTIGIIVICFTVIVGVGLFTFNYRKNKVID